MTYLKMTELLKSKRNGIMSKRERVHHLKDYCHINHHSFHVLFYDITHREKDEISIYEY